MGTARLLGGLLSLWTRRPDGLLYESSIGQGWGTAAQIAGLTLNPNTGAINFIELKTNGYIFEWTFVGGSNWETNRGNDDGSMRLIG